MPPLPTQTAPTPGRSGDPAPALWRAAKEQLETVKAQLLEELRQYPPPIPACDAQFNYLLERRDAASRALAQLDAISGTADSAAAQARAVRDLIRSSQAIDVATGQRLLADFPE